MNQDPKPELDLVVIPPVAFQFVLATPDGPRPAIFVVSREPQGLKFDQSKEFASRYIPFGMDAMYGVTPAFWQTAVRVLQQPE